MCMRKREREGEKEMSTKKKTTLQYFKPNQHSRIPVMRYSDNSV